MPFDVVRTYALGKKAWPSLELSFEAFQEASTRDFEVSTDLSDDLVKDLFLACACAKNVRGALHCFRDQYFLVVSLAVRRFDESLTFADEVYQRLSELLFVGGPSARPKIFRYSGHGALAGFVSTAARRIALRMATSSARFQGEEALIHEFSEAHQLEHGVLKRQHSQLFNRALSVALRELPTRDRLILRLNVVDRISTARIAAMYKVSQPTVSRWIQRSARAIFATVKDLVCDELEIDTRELDSLLLLVRSQIEITISHVNNDGNRPE